MPRAVTWTPEKGENQRVTDKFRLNNIIRTIDVFVANNLDTGIPVLNSFNLNSGDILKDVVV
jgi:hypothetical protein